MEGKFLSRVIWECLFTPGNPIPSEIQDGTVFLDAGKGQKGKIQFPAASAAEIHKSWYLDEYRWAGPWAPRQA